jgi:cell wall-associated NlpC family hydrolase
MGYSNTPSVGQFGVTRIHGLTGRLIEVGQRLIGSGSRFTHAFVVVADGWVVQAEPGGARLVPLSSVVGGRDTLYSDLALTDEQRQVIRIKALRLAHTPYSYLDYLAIAARRLFGVSFLERYVEDSGHMICSQLVDEVFREAGIELFPARIPGDVVPGDLARLIGA